MGDDGELYSTYTPELMRGMRELSRHAQVLTPNLTEACFLTDTPYQSTAEMQPDTALRFAHGLLDGLHSLTDGRIVITGIHLADGTLANVGMEQDGTRFCVRAPHEAVSDPGTGDIFASVLLGALLADGSFSHAVEVASDFVRTVIRDSANIPTPVREGVALESHLWRLCAKTSSDADPNPNRKECYRDV